MRRLFLVAVGAVTCGVFGFAWVKDRFGQRERAEFAAGVVVLGARVLPGSVSSGALRARTSTQWT